MHILEIIKNSLQGNTMTRILFNLHYKNFTIEGNVLDAGAKSRYISYYNYINHEKANITFADLKKNQNGFISMDFEKKLPIKSNEFDYVLLMNVLEHVYNHKSFLEELNRILKKGGVLVGFVPFLISFHADPGDFYRYTHTCLKKLLEDSGYREINIKLIGEGSLLVIADLIRFYFPKHRYLFFLRPLSGLLSSILYIINSLMFFIGKGMNKPNNMAYLGISFEAKK
tara:strand:- start:2349 stop:3029 length:681 start_codon:yes stop_codon:yes gene_type:complete